MLDMKRFSFCRGDRLLYNPPMHDNCYLATLNKDGMVQVRPRMLYGLSSNL
jgi:hypothetical protein